MSPSQPEPGFAYRREQFQQIVEDTLATARQMGASDAGAEVSEGVGLSVSVRLGELENVERNRDKSLGVSVYLGQRRGNASTSDFSPAAIARTVQAAYDIARFTAEDPAAGLPDADDLARPDEVARDLELFHPWAIDAAQAAAIALRCEDAARATSRRIANSEGASVSAQQSHFWAGNTRGFRGGYASSRHFLSVSPIAGRGRHMQRDAWSSSMRDPADLATPEAVGRYAAERALARLNPRRVPTAEVPVLFESTVAVGLLGSLVTAVSGGPLYRKASFLLDSLGTRVLPEHVDVFEDPHVAKGKGSAMFDDEGVRTRARRVVDGGLLEGYFLSSYSARKLGMKTTGHAGGAQNLVLTSRLTSVQDDLDAMIRRLRRGLFVTELMGQGVNGVTGDYSRGAAGFWVEDGCIAYPVQEITIAGNLRRMLRDIVAVGADAYTSGTRTIGSVLVERMKLAGQ
ncbi:MAG: metalloprotease PmbA [Burkholderiales bacterium]|nr:metalloprotease PmbA [Burkholderiales bacterium]